MLITQKMHILDHARRASYAIYFTKAPFNGNNDNKVKKKRQNGFRFVQIPKKIERLFVLSLN